MGYEKQGIELEWPKETHTNNGNEATQHIGTQNDD